MRENSISFIFSIIMTLFIENIAVAAQNCTPDDAEYRPECAYLIGNITGPRSDDNNWGKNTEIIIEVQTLLFDRNWDVGDIDGVFGNKTRNAIRAFEKQNNLDVTGNITPRLLELLRNAESPTRWAAVAFLADGRYGAVWNATNRQEAINAAMGECIKGIGQAVCQSSKVSTAFDNNCIGLATSQFGSFSGGGANPSSARTDTILECRNFYKSRCKLAMVICADGSHQSNTSVSSSDENSSPASRDLDKEISTLEKQIMELEKKSGN